jgi:glycosyltransferase involved in cell wall biosynthesis
MLRKCIGTVPKREAYFRRMPQAAPLLLVVYKFPPFKGIGGRRWAKFAKELAARGHQVHVVTCAPAPDETGSSWTHDVDRPGIHVHRLPRRHPRMLVRGGAGIVAKLHYRAALAVVSALSQGDPLDRAVFWRKPLLRVCRKLIAEHGIRHVLVSGAPFRLLSHVAALRDTPGLHLAADLRDPWTWGHTYGWQLMSPARRRQEAAIEAATLPAFDRLCAPSQVFLDGLAAHHPALAARCVHLPHPIDPDDLAPLDPVAQNTVAPAVFAGSFYDRPESLRFIDALIDAVRRLPPPHGPSAAGPLVDLYVTSHLPPDARERVARAGLQHAIRFLDPIAPRALMDVFRRCRFALSFHPAGRSDLVPTKFHELLCLGTPVLHVGEPGSTCDFIAEHRMGECIRLAELAERLPAYLAGTATLPKPAPEGARHFLLPHLTDRLLHEVLGMEPAQA